MGRLEATVAIGMGGSQRVRQGIALALAKEGAAVVVAGRTEVKFKGITVQVQRARTRTAALP